MRVSLAILFLLILLGMLGICVVASMDRGIGEAARELMPDPWFQATLLDAYCGFLTVYVWVAYKENAVLQRVIWFALIMTLGNIAISIYLLIQLYRWQPETGAAGLLLRPSPVRSIQ